MSPFARRRHIAIGLVLVAITSLAAWASAQDGRPRTGAMIYDEHCARCHGLSGAGDGPDAPGLMIRPTNFTVARSRMKNDFELLTAIAYGLAYSPMHGWRGRLTDEEILEVLEHIRKLAPFEPAL